MSSKSNLSIRQCGGCGKKSRSTRCDECHGGRKKGYREHCPRPVCPRPCKGDDAYTIFQRYGSAVVHITAQTVLTNTCDPCQRVCTDICPPEPCSSTHPRECPLIFNQNIATYVRNGTGFFIAGHLIVTAASNIQLPPDIGTVYSRYPYQGPGQIQPNVLKADAVVRASRIVARVSDVNGTGADFAYDLELLGFSGTGDVALLTINRRWKCNRKLLCIKKCHPFFKFGCSRKQRPGMKAFILGDIFTRGWPLIPVGVPPTNLSAPFTGPGQSVLGQTTGINAITEGVIQTVRGLDYLGYAQQELVLVDAHVSAFKNGAPILNDFGQVIGIQTLNNIGASPYGVSNPANLVTTALSPVGDGMVGGPSSFYIGRVIFHLHAALTNRCSPFVTSVADPFGNFFLLTSGYVGLSWTQFTEANYINYIDPNGKVAPLYESDGKTPKCCGKKRQIIGATIRALAGGPSPAGIVVPGVLTPSTLGFPDSPLLGYPNSPTYNDVITHVGGDALGDGIDQIPISLLTSRVMPGQVVEFCYRKLCDCFSKIYTLRVQLNCLPHFYNFPWYKYPEMTALLRDLQPINGANFLSLLPVLYSTSTVVMPAI